MPAAVDHSGGSTVRANRNARRSAFNARSTCENREKLSWKPGFPLF